MNLNNIFKVIAGIFGAGKYIADKRKQKQVESQQTTKSKLDELVDKIIERDYSQYEIKCNQRFSIGEKQQESININKSLFFNGQLSAIIILVDEHEDNRRVYKELKQDCINKNIKFINFFRRMENKEEYVENRINSLMSK